MIILVILITLCVVVAIGKGKINFGEKEKFPDVVIVPDFELKYRVVSNCNNENDCNIKDSQYYRITDYNENPDLAEFIRRINSRYINRASDLEEGKYTFDDCPSKSYKYKYRYIDKAYIYYYVNDTVAAITQDLISQDVCTDEKITPIFDTYYYDVKRQKVVDEEAFLKLLNVNKKDTDKMILDYLIDKKVIKDEIDYDNMVVGNRIRCYVFLSMEGDLAAKCIYPEDNSYEDFLLYNHAKLGLTIKMPS